VTNRGEEACECVVKLTNTNFFAKAAVGRRRQPHSRQAPPGDEQKPHTRPTAQGELAADSETKPKIRAEVYVALGWGQITCSTGRCQNDLVANIKPMKTSAEANVPYSGRASSCARKSSLLKRGVGRGNTNPRWKSSAEGILAAADTNGDVKARTFQDKERTTDEL
jgi:hypothetical protein